MKAKQVVLYCNIFFTQIDPQEPAKIKLPKYEQFFNIMYTLMYIAFHPFISTHCCNVILFLHGIKYKQGSPPPFFMQRLPPTRSSTLTSATKQSFLNNRYTQCNQHHEINHEQTIPKKACLPWHSHLSNFITVQCYGS